MAELFKPQSSAFTELWLNGADGQKDKVVEMEYWLKDLEESGDYYHCYYYQYS